MYVTLHGKVLSAKDIEKYNSDKKAFQIFPSLLWRCTSVKQMLDMDEELKQFDEWITQGTWETRSRVSKDGCSLLYCLVGDTKIFLKWGTSWEDPYPEEYEMPIPKPYKIIKPIDFKFWKEDDVDNPPAETLEVVDGDEEEDAWNNRLIRCKCVHNWDESLLKEFHSFVEAIPGMEVEYSKPYIKATFDAQHVKDEVFERMSDEFEWEGDNINYFRRGFRWTNVTLKEYEQYYGAIVN